MPGGSLVIDSQPKFDVDTELAFTLLADRLGLQDVELIVKKTGLENRDPWAAEALTNWTKRLGHLPSSFVIAVSFGSRNSFLSAVFNCARYQQAGGVWAHKAVAAFSLNGPKMWLTEQSFLQDYKQSVYKLSWASHTPITGAFAHRSEATWRLAEREDVVVYHWTEKSSRELWATRQKDALVTTVQMTLRDSVVKRDTIMFPEGIHCFEQEERKVLNWAGGQRWKRTQK